MRGFLTDVKQRRVGGCSQRERDLRVDYVGRDVESASTGRPQLYAAD